MKALAGIAAVDLVALALLVALTRVSVHASLQPPPTSTPVRVAADGCGGRPEPDCVLTHGCRGQYGGSSTGNAQTGISGTGLYAFKACVPDFATVTTSPQ